MKSNEIRSTFLDYFRSKGHTVVPSSSLVPVNDPTLLFVNSGMVQFKDVFLGKEKRPYVRATSSQRSLRAGGKHNDLENVGYTARHHTFFEMLGNFSFGDYFKKDAIRFAWELLTKVFKLPPERLWATVYHTDDEAYELWSKMVGLPKERVIRIGDKSGGQKYQSDNFWQMADTGPCGPCSEIFYDHGPGIEGGPPGSPDADGDRYIEIWNLVFMQFNREKSGDSFVMHPLPRPSVDTGMGLERIAAILQGKHSNYEIDLFQDLIRAAARETHQKDLKNPSLNVIADHIRACSFLIVDGVIPGNEGRGYVLRRIIRRAIRHGYKLGQTKPFFHRLVYDLDRVMGSAYPELTAARDRVIETLKQEEERFAETLETGMRLFDIGSRVESRAISYVRDHVVKDFKYFEDLSAVGKDIGLDAVFHKANEDVVVETKVLTNATNVQEVVRQFEKAVDIYEKRASKPVRGYLVFAGKSERPPEDLIDLTNPDESKGRKSNVRVLYLKEDSLPFDGQSAFLLYDTYGFPFDLTQDLCRERHIPIDVSGFDSSMEAQRERARSASKFSMATGLDYSGVKTEFHGYDTLTLRAKVVALYKEGTPVNELRAGDAGVVVLDRTPFYAESGGQVGDRGELAGPAGTFAVEDTQKIQAEVFGHHGKQRTGLLRVGDMVNAQVDTVSRRRAMWNHSATHLMHAALRQVLGKHVEQKGSLVDAQRTRFDFSHPKPLTAEEIAQVEALVNAAIQRNEDVTARIMKYDDAMRAGALAFFGDKYGDEVRVLTMGEFSTELCGGTHVRRTGDIGFFKIVSESGVAAGIRRIEAVTGEGALAWVQQIEQDKGFVEDFFQAKGEALKDKLKAERDERRTLEKELARLKSKLAASHGEDLAALAVDVKGAKVLAATLEGADAKTLRETMDKLKDRLKSAAIVLGSVADGKVSLIAGVTADLTAKVKAGELVNFVAQQVGGKGGGRPDMAQAGGTQPGNLLVALQSVKSWVEQRV